MATPFGKFGRRRLWGKPEPPLLAGQKPDAGNKRSTTVGGGGKNVRHVQEKNSPKKIIPRRQEKKLKERKKKDKILNPKGQSNNALFVRENTSKF